MYRTRLTLAAFLLLGGATAALAQYVIPDRTPFEDAKDAAIRLGAAALKFHVAAQKLPSGRYAGPLLEGTQELRTRIDLFRTDLEGRAEPRRVARKFDRVSRAYDQVMGALDQLRPDDRARLARKADKLRDAYEDVAHMMGR